MKIFHGVRLSLSEFALIFAKLPFEGRAKEIVDILCFGQQKYESINGYSCSVSYYRDDKFQFKFSQLHTNEILNEFRKYEHIFLEQYGLQLVVNKDKFIRFYIGREAKITESTMIDHIKGDPQTKKELDALFTSLLFNQVNPYYLYVYLIV